MPNSRRIAFSIDSRGLPPGVDRPSGIYTVRIDGSDLRLLVADAQMPAYSPRGSRLAFVRGGDIVVSNADGTNVRRVTETAAADDRPAWSPDGRLLAFSRVVRSRSVIVVARSDGTRARTAVSSARYHASLPSWRPAAPLPPARRPACP
jgi:Tol biopolymer transport system component